MSQGFKNIFFYIFPFFFHPFPFLFPCCFSLLVRPVSFFSSSRPGLAQLGLSLFRSPPGPFQRSGTGGATPAVDPNRRAPPIAGEGASMSTLSTWLEVAPLLFKPCPS